MYTITRPYHLPFLARIVNPLLTSFTIHPPLLPFQFIILSRQAALALFIALSQIGPWFQLAPPAAPGPQLQQINRLESLAMANNEEASRLLALDMAPFAGDQEGTTDLKGRVKDWLVQNTIRADPEVKDAVRRALEMRRVASIPDDH